MTIALVALCLAFAWSMGAHYTGACMGIPHALGIVSARRALWLMAPLALLGAALASHRVEHTVGAGLLGPPGLSPAGLVIAVGVAFGLTSLFNRLRIPTSTIQILVSSVVGTGLGTGADVRWPTIGWLALVWVCAPPAAAVSGYLLTRTLDRTGGPPGTWSGPAVLVVGALASFTMGGNDVANATGPLVGTHTFTPLVAGSLGGIGLAAGVLTWGRPLLQRVAFEIVTVDRPMAVAAQSVQAGVVLAAVGFGFFTSLNQALVGAMAGAGAARGRRAVHAATVRAIGRGWLIGPAAGVAAAYLLAGTVAAVAGGSGLLSGR